MKQPKLHASTIQKFTQKSLHSGSSFAVTTKVLLGVTHFHMPAHIVRSFPFQRDGADAASLRSLLVDSRAMTFEISLGAKAPITSHKWTSVRLLMASHMLPHAVSLSEV